MEYLAQNFFLSKLSPRERASDEFKKISPQGTIPTLISHNITLCESEAINEYLNAKFPNPRMSCWIDFTKGLGSPMGAVLAGSAEFFL